MTEPMPIPAVHDHDSAPFWAAAAEHRLVVAVGAESGVPVHPPRQFGVDTPIRWREAVGTATVHSWTVVEHQVDPSFPAPYTIVLVELTDYPGVRYVGYLDGRPQLEPGTPVRVRFEDRGEVTVPQWELTRAGQSTT